METSMIRFSNTLQNALHGEIPLKCLILSAIQLLFICRTLPESPPDSSSEPYSPQQVNGKFQSSHKDYRQYNLHLH